MKEYHKIQSLFKRDMENGKKLLVGQWTLPEFEYLAYNVWEFSEKIDGTNIRVGYENGKISFGGRSDNAQIPAKLVDRLRERFSDPNLFETVFEGASVCLYGEGYGSGIQKVGDGYSKDQDFILFDVKVGDWWLKRSAVENIASIFSIPVVPIVGSGTLMEAVKLAKEGFVSNLSRNVKAEGIVARPLTELMTRGGDRIITKLKYKDFN